MTRKMEENEAIEKKIDELYKHTWPEKLEKLNKYADLQDQEIATLRKVIFS